MSKKLNPQAVEFGRRLKAELEAQGLSQDELAFRIHRKKGTDARGYEYTIGKDRISSYVNGKAMPRDKALSKICKALGVSKDKLVPQQPLAAPAASAPGVMMFVPHHLVSNVLALLSQAGC